MVCTDPAFRAPKLGRRVVSLQRASATSAVVRPNESRRSVNQRPSPATFCAAFLFDQANSAPRRSPRLPASPAAIRRAYLAPTGQSQCQTADRSGRASVLLRCRCQQLRGSTSARPRHAWPHRLAAPLKYLLFRRHGPIEFRHRRSGGRPTWARPTQAPAAQSTDQQPQGHQSVCLDQIAKRLTT